jgi:hypothetical protein
VEDLYSAVLDSFENGHSASDTTRHTSKTYCVLAGGFSALKGLYPWHPGMAGGSEEINPRDSHNDFHFDTGNIHIIAYIHIYILYSIM